MHYPARRTTAKSLLSITPLLGAGWAGAQSCNMITPAELKKRLESCDKPMLLNIQVESDYARDQLPGALPTCAYPAKSDDARGV